MESKVDRKAKSIEIVTSSFIVVHVDSLQLQVTVSMVTASGVYPMLITDDLPNLATDLVATLANLDVHTLMHGAGCRADRGADPQTLQQESIKSLTVLYTSGILYRNMIFF